MARCDSNLVGRFYLVSLGMGCANRSFCKLSGCHSGKPCILLVSALLSDTGENIVIEL